MLMVVGGTTSASAVAGRRMRIEKACIFFFGKRMLTYEKRLCDGDWEAGSLKGGWGCLEVLRGGSGKFVEDRLGEEEENREINGFSYRLSHVLWRHVPRPWNIGWESKCVWVD